MGLLRRAAQLILFLLFAAAILIDTTHWLKAWSIWPRIAGALGVLYLTHRYSVRHFKRDVEQSHHDSTLNQVGPQQARELQREVTDANPITSAQAELFARAVVEASELQKRIVERYEPGRRTLRQEVTIDVQIPEAVMKRMRAQEVDEDTERMGPVHGPPAIHKAFYFPVMVPPKAVLYDNLKVYGADTGELPTLSYREYVHIAASVLHMLLAAAFYSHPKELPPAAAECEEASIAGIIKRIDPRPGREDPSEHVGESAGTSAAQLLAKSLRELNIESGREASTLSDQAKNTRQRAIRLAASLVKVLTTHYAIVVEIPLPSTGRFSVTYECTLIPELDLTARPEGTLRPRADSNFTKLLRACRAHLEILLGARPINIKVSLDSAWACQSYHVIVRCPDSLYVSSQRLILPAPNYLKRWAKNAPTPPHIRFRRRLGQSYSHFYGRYLSEPRTWVYNEDGIVKHRRERAPKLVLSFAEVPPGSLCRAALAAIAAVGLVWIIGYGLAHLHGGLLSTDAPALFLVFPGVVAGWLGLESATHQLFEGPLTARLSLACTTALSLTAAALYLLHTDPSQSSTRDTKASSVHTAFQLGVLGIVDWRWIAIVVVLLFNATYLSYRWGINAWRFRYLGARSDPAGHGVSEHGEAEQAETGRGANNGRDTKGLRKFHN